MTVGDNVKMMSILNRKRKNEVISVRLNDERLQLLERYRKLLTEQLGRPISLAEAAFIILEERVEGVDRASGLIRARFGRGAGRLSEPRSRRSGTGFAGLRRH